MSGFFLQAEDGIRDLVRSRGLGYVYKRQPEGDRPGIIANNPQPGRELADGFSAGQGQHGRRAVSYTHLTLPTSDLV